MNRNLRAYAAFVLSSAAIACGSSGGSNDPGQSPNGGSTGDDAGTVHPGPSTGDDAGAVDSASPPDHGAPSTTYPAFQPSFGQLQNQGGYVMKNPVVVAITWNDDPSQAAFESYVDAIGSTAYWNAASSEYGVAAAVSGSANHVHVTTASPAQITDAELQSMVQTNAGVTAGWPAPTKDTVYAFFLGPKTSLQTQTMTGSGTQDACAAGEGGYHDQTDVGNTTTSYAVVPSCTFPSSPSTPAQQTTMSMSHELLEAATDPDPQAGPGFLGFDHDYFAFNYFQELQAENGDACEFYRDSFFEDKETTPSSFDAWVQRTWSNASAKAGHNPCVPAAPGVYFNVTPLDLQDVKVTIPPQVTGLLPGLSPQTKGFRAQTGSSVTFAVGFYSDAPTGGPWTISVAPSNPLLTAHGQSLIDQYNPATIIATVDKTSGENGEKANVTVSVTSAGTLFHGEIVTVTSTLNGVSHYMPVWIAGD